MTVYTRWETGTRGSNQSANIDAGIHMQPAKTYGTGEKVILSVEDDDAAFVLLEFGFSEVGGDFRLYRVEDGAQALDFLRQSNEYDNAPKPDLILLNLNLPRVSGFDVLQTIQDDASLSDIPAV